MRRFGTLLGDHRVLLALGAAYLALLGTASALTTAALDRLLSETVRMVHVVPDDAGSRRTKVEAEVISEVLADRRPPAPFPVAQTWSNRLPPSLPPNVKNQPPQKRGIFGLLLNVPEPPPVIDTYATICVRTCDGYYFPISFSTTPERFGRDEKICQSSCGSQAKLFIYRNPGDTPEGMQDLRGNAYSRLPNAFLYRTSYNESCKCRPHPWEQEARDVHRVYALEQSVRRGDVSKTAELKALRERVALPTAPKAGSVSSPMVTAQTPKAPLPGMMSLGKGSPSSTAWRNDVYNFNR